MKRSGRCIKCGHTVYPDDITDAICAPCRFAGEITYPGSEPRTINEDAWEIRLPADYCYDTYHNYDPIGAVYDNWSERRQR